MSLFQARDWWVHRPDQDEECHDGCLCVANIDNSSSNTDKIITGSFQGYLRIYTPKQSGGFKVDELMEFMLDEPILQIEAGRFVNQGGSSGGGVMSSSMNSGGGSSGGKLSLAVLHPRKLVIYNIVAIGTNGKMLSGGGAGTGGGGAAEQASYYDLNKVYEHKLERTAYNFCYGPFGGVYGRDFICVQSMDGQLSFFEQDNYAFSRYLSSANNFLLPGPLCYVPKIDCFILSNSNLDVEAFKYQILGASAHANKGGGGRQQEDQLDDNTNTSDSINTAKKIQSDWSLNLGEHILSIQVARYSRSLAASNIDILILGEQTLFTLKENGTIRLQKRLQDYNPSTCITYQNVEYTEQEKDVGGSNQNLIIGTHQSSLMIYKDMQLIWAARTSFVPVAVRTGCFAGIKGLIVALSEKCELQISYLGTDPPLNGTMGSGSGASGVEGVKELDYEGMDEEHRTLLKVIKQVTTDSMQEPKEKVMIKTQISPVLMTNDNYPDLYQTNLDPLAGQQEDDELTCVKDERTSTFIQIIVRLYVSWNGKSDINNLHLALQYSPAFFSSCGREIIIPTLTGGSKTPLILPIRFRVKKNILPESLNLTILGSYITGVNQNESRTSRHDTALPLSLIARLITPLKNAAFMFTLDTTRPPPAAGDVWQDLLEPAVILNPDIARTSANVLTFQYYSTGADVTILTSAKTGRYRIQSNNFESLFLITNELNIRLQRFHTESDFIKMSKGVKEKASEGKKSSSSPTDDQSLIPFAISFKDQHLPLADYFLLIDRHFTIRQNISYLKASLEQLSTQFRTIQKRLLVRYRDKTPAPLISFDVLLQETFEQIQERSGEIVRLQGELSEISCTLASGTNLIQLLIQFKYDLTEREVSVLRAYLTSNIALYDQQQSSSEIGWEEIVDMNLTHLLRTVLAKNKNGVDTSGGASATQPTERLQDLAKLKKHIQIVCDRLGKGMKLVKRGGKGEKEKEKSKAARTREAVLPPKPIPVAPVQSALPKPEARRKQQHQHQEELREEPEEEEAKEQMHE